MSSFISRHLVVVVVEQSLWSLSKRVSFPKYCQSRLRLSRQFCLQLCSPRRHLICIYYSRNRLVHAISTAPKSTKRLWNTDIQINTVHLKYRKIKSTKQIFNTSLLSISAFFILTIVLRWRFLIPFIDCLSVWPWRSCPTYLRSVSCLWTSGCTVAVGPARLYKFPLRTYSSL